VNVRRVVLLNVMIFIVIVAAGFVGYYFYNQSTLYLKTDNAQVTGRQIVIAAPATGKIVSWNGNFNSTFNAGDTVGTLQVAAANGVHNLPITIPASGTIVQNNAMTNEYVAAGMPLAYAYDLQHLTVTANIKETDIRDVKPGQDVDVYVDAEPGVTIKGTVASIGLATANTFSLLPTQSTTADYTKVTQVIPVTITLQGYQGIGLVPGMSATVRIHK
jgi:multidrug resistance efflux pump